jgi:cytochrome P450
LGSRRGLRNPLRHAAELSYLGEGRRKAEKLVIAGRGLGETPYLRGDTIFGSARVFRDDPLGFIESARREHGDFVRIRLGPYRVYLLLGPEQVGYLLQKNPGNYLKDGYEHNEPLTGRGLLTSEGDFWRRQRRLVQPAFHKERLRGMAETMTEATEEMLGRWQDRLKEGGEQPLEIDTEMSRLTLSIVSRTLMGTDVSGGASGVGRSLEYTLWYAFRRTGRFFNPPFGFPTPKNLRYMKAIRTLDAIVYSLIDGCRGGGADGGDLLSMLVQARDSDTGEGMSRKQLRDEVMTFLAAGYETTARALAWTFYLLHRNAEEGRRLRDELARVLSGRTPIYEDLPRLLYTKMLVEESMRLYPPVWGLARRAKGEDEIGGHRVPKGSRLIISSYVTHRHPAFWEHPEKFDPERFTPERSEGRPRYAYFPFGGGPRQCIGVNFATMEATLIVAMVAQRFDLSLVPGHPVEPQANLTLIPRYGLPMVPRAIAL